MGLLEGVGGVVGGEKGGRGLVEVGGVEGLVGVLGGEEREERLPMLCVAILEVFFLNFF